MAVTVDASKLKDAVRARYSEVVDDAFTDMLADMERDAPRDTGAMTQRIEVAERDGDRRIERTIHAPQEYSSYQDEGTGIYGPRGEPIRPVRARVLHFRAKDGTEVFVREVKGTPRTGWWSDKVAKFQEYLERAMRR